MKRITPLFSAITISVLFCAPSIHAGVDELVPSTHDLEPTKPSTDRFHFTTIRAWGYRDYLPDSDDADILGLEFNSAWGWGNWNVSNISYIEFADYPRAVPGKPYGNSQPGIKPATGVTDLLSAFFFSRKSDHHSHHHFSYGFASQFPTASSETLGSGQWSLGPAIEYEYKNGRFYAAFVALQLWSVGGDSARKPVNMMMIKPMVTYEVIDNWKAVYMPYGISVYWDKKKGQKAYLPLGGGIQHDFKIGSQEMGFSAQFFKYVIRPDKGSQYDLRFLLEFNF